MKRLVLIGAVIVFLAGCGGPEVVTVETLTQEFCDGIADLLDLPKTEREVRFVELNQRIDEALLREGVDDEALAFNIFGECGEELILMGAPD
ncbi:MAG: hypothetical protein QF719_11570 [Chloroflexota bacterium]|jgi:hypothetical protein|nr:hypothetical protein [Chloroflexota bacterium]MDP6758818.1 hypothetical protein [Chloroflexota bacterium]